MSDDRDTDMDGAPTRVNIAKLRAEALAASDEKEPDQLQKSRSRQIADRDNDYTARRFDRTNGKFSPTRDDPFSAAGGAAGNDVGVNTAYADAMRQQQQQRDLRDTAKQLANQPPTLPSTQNGNDSPSRSAAALHAEMKKRKLMAMHADGDTDMKPESKEADTKPTVESKAWDDDDDDTPLESDSDAKGSWAARPTSSDAAVYSKSSSAWDATPLPSEVDESKQAKPVTSSTRSSRWDATPAMVQSGATPLYGATPRSRSRWDVTPAPGAAAISAGDATPLNYTAATPAPSTMYGATPMSLAAMTPAERIQADSNERNRPLTDAEIDEMLPKTGYEIVPPPADYVPIMTPARKLAQTPAPMQLNTGYQLPDRQTFSDTELPPTPLESGLPGFTKPEDVQFFGKLLEDVNDHTLSKAELNERRIMTLLLKIKNGSAPQRKTAMRALTDQARTLGAGPLLDQILPMLMSQSLEDQQRHLLVKAIDRILFKLDDLIRPYVHKILVVVEPLLIDEDYAARMQGREIIGNLAKAAGLATMIATLRPDIDSNDEYVRNTTARAFAVVCTALGTHQMLPFLRAVCRSKRSWEARHTGMKIVQQLALLLGCGVLPYLRVLVETIGGGLQDEQSKVRCICGLALAALAESSAPYGIESFDSVLRPLWKGIREHRGKTLAAYLKAIGYIIPLMDANYASYYTKEVMPIVCREFASPDEEMKRIVLKVAKQCIQTAGIEPTYIRTEIVPPLFTSFWVRRTALDRRNARQVIDTTVAVASKCGPAEVIGRLAADLKDASEPYRRMVIEAIELAVTASGNGLADVDAALEGQLMDGLLYAFQEQQLDVDASNGTTRQMVNAIGAVVAALGSRAKLYLPQIAGVLKWRLNNKSSAVRGQAADLVARLAVVMYECGEHQLLNHLAVVLYEYLGEEYPDVLGSILAALSAIVACVGCDTLTPSVRDLLPRLTPILRNRHEKVQEHCIELIGRIADRGAQYVSAKEWMRITFELLELLRANRKAIRRATVSTFGYIARAIGPTDVLATLLNNLKVQDRQMRVCCTVAIAIVAETCAPFTVLPALLNEYRIPELNVQNGVLKSLSFLYEYIASGGSDYVYATLPILDDALIDRDAVHRQIASNVIKHMALGSVGLNREDAMIHLLNLVWPNIFETSPHVIQAVIEAIDALRLCVGPGRILQYIVQGLFHPARRVRTVYWRLYNHLYTSSQDQLTAYYPRLPDDDSNVNQYRRHELEMFI